MANNYRIGTLSQQRLDTCHPDLQEVVVAVMQMQVMDFAVLCGHRTQEEQLELFAAGLSKVKNSKHNEKPSRAIDIAPYKVRTVTEKDKARYYMLAGLVVAAARDRGIKIRCGADWDGDGKFNDQTFDDLAHFELVD